MMYKRIVFFQIILFFLFINFYDMQAQVKGEIDYFHDTTTINKPLLTNDTLIENDTNNVDMSKDSLKKGKYVPYNEFFYADNPRHTIDGSLPLENTEIKTIPTIITGSIYTGIFVLQHIGQMQTIWKEQGDFKFQEDGNYAFYTDKVGHVYGCYLSSYLLSEALMTCGFSYDAASLWGGVMGFSYSLYVEILDGFGKNWGFSPSDFYCNTAGAALFVGQHYIPFLQNFTPKFMYFPAPWFGELHRQPFDMFIDDYSSHTIWLSVNVHNILPNSIKDYWPPWMQLSFGYAARNLCDINNPDLYTCDPKRSEVQVNGGYRGSPRFILALDYDLVKVLPEGGSFWNWIRQGLNYVKMPSPAIEFGSVTKVYLVYPFHF